MSVSTMKTKTADNTARAVKKSSAYPPDSLVGEIERMTSCGTRKLAWTYVDQLVKYTKSHSLRLPPKVGPICAFLASEKYVSSFSHL